MSPHKAGPISRAIIYLAGARGVSRGAGETLDDARARSEPVDPSTRYEGLDVHAKGVFLTGVGVLLAIWALVLVMYLLFNYFRYARVGGQTPSTTLVYRPELPPEPRNESAPYRVLNQFLAQEDLALNSYHWVDRKNGIISIPIERAMRLVAQRGIPPAGKGTNSHEMTQAGSMRTGFEGKVEPLPR